MVHPNVNTISFQEILPIWNTHLWPNRISEIAPNSAMCYLEGYSSVNMQTNPTFFAYIIDDQIAGVNSGHMCENKYYRSRGLYVFDEYRGQGIGKALLIETINQGMLEGAEFCWSYPRLSSWKTYASAGFKRTTDWEKSETSDDNAYCIHQYA